MFRVIILPRELKGNDLSRAVKFLKKEKGKHPDQEQHVFYVSKEKLATETKFLRDSHDVVQEKERIIILDDLGRRIQCKELICRKFRQK